MTDVLVRLTAPSSGAAASGWVPADEVAAVGHLECRPYAPDADGARLHLEAPDRLLLPASMPPVRLVAGEALLHLAPTGAGWCWQIIERTPRGKTRYVLVPDSVAVLDYADLVDVDPATLAATAEPEAAWWAAVDGIGGDTFGEGVVPIFETLAQAEAWEAANPGRVALTLESTEPDITPPSAGGLAVDMGHTTATLTVSGAADDRGVAGYSFKIDSGAWSDWQNSHVYEATGLAGSTAYAFQHRVRDAAGNIAEGIATTGTTLAAPPAQAGEVITSDGFSGTGATAGRMTDCEHGGTPIAWNGTIQVADGATDPAVTTPSQPVLPIAREDVRVDFTVLSKPATSRGMIRLRDSSASVHVMANTGDIQLNLNGATVNLALLPGRAGPVRVRVEVQGADVRAWAWAAGEAMPSAPQKTGTTATTGAHPLDISQRPGFSITDLVVTAL